MRGGWRRDFGVCFGGEGLWEGVLGMGFGVRERGFSWEGGWGCETAKSWVESWR